jgi:hypothetical protein
MRPHRFEVGEPVMFRVTKRSPHPGPRAIHVEPEPLGEGYTYDVDKFWVVQEVRPDGRLVLRTRRGKQHVVHADHERLRPARWWDRLLYGDRFPQAV